MTKEREALKLALEAFNDLAAWNDGEVGSHMDEPYAAEVARRIITAIEEALAQQALDRKAENARELGLDYEPAGHGGRPMTLRECMEAEEPEQEPKCGAIIEVFGKGWRLEYLSLPVGKHKLYTQQYTYTTPPQRKPLMWISTADQMPPLGVRVFWMDQDSNRVGYDTWMGNNFRFTPSHWMHIPAIEAAHNIKE